MNFNDHHLDIKKLLVRAEKRKSANPNKPDQEQFYKGIYVISRDQEIDKNKTLQYKVGMAHGDGGIYKRMDGYKMCFPYPDEFWMHFCVITPKSQDAISLEKKILADKHMKPVKNPRNTAQNTEYRTVIKKATLHNSLLRALKNNPKLWDYCVVFGEKGWKLLENSGADLVNSGALSKPPNDFSKQPMLYSEDKDRIATETLKMRRNTSKIIDFKRKLPVDINTIKKGDMIQDFWHKKKGEYAIVVKVSKKGKQGNQNPYIEVESEQYPEGYILYLH